MPEILLYSTRICPYCIMAKRLLDKKGLKYTEINIDGQAGLREELVAKTRHRTVPQIFIGDVFVGGFDELYSLDQQKKLDLLLTDGFSI